MNRLFYILFFLLLSFRVFAMTNTEAIQFVNRYYDLLNQYAVVKNDAPGLARQITSMHIENAGSIYPDVEVKLGGLPDTKGVVISTYLTSISDPERKKSMLLKFVPKDITIKSNSGGVICISYILDVYDDNVTPNTSVLKYSIPLEMHINQYYKIKNITKSYSIQTTTLSASPTSLSFEASGGSRTITVNSNKDWSIGVKSIGVKAASWVTLIHNHTTFITVHVNENTGEERSTYFIIKAGDKEQKVTITQGNQESNNEPSAQIHRIWTEDDIYEDGVRGVKIHLNMNVYNLKSKQCRAVAYFYTNSGTALIDTNNKYHTKNGKVSCGKDFAPSYDNSLYKDFSIFMPYNELHTSTNGSYKLDVVLWDQSVSPSKEITRSDRFSITYDVSDVKKNIDIHNGHEYVDLGLSVMWATCNVGAYAPEDLGDYYAWGEINIKKVYGWETYKYCKGTYNSLTKYCTRNNFGFVDNKTILEALDDAARTNWGGSWRTPTKQELEELIANCIWTYSSRNGVTGYYVKSKINGNTIFLPMTDGGYPPRSRTNNSFAWYRSSTLYVDKPNNAYLMYMNTNEQGIYEDRRWCGLTIRPVVNK